MRKLAAAAAAVFLAAGITAVSAGSYTHDRISEELTAAQIQFSPEFDEHEAKLVGRQYEGVKVDTGPEARAFAAYIGSHTTDMPTYSEASSASRAYAEQVGENPTPEEQAKQAELDGTVAVAFKAATLRSMLLNADGWWLVGSVVQWFGVLLMLSGAVLGGLSFRRQK